MKFKFNLRNLTAVITAFNIVVTTFNSIRRSRPANPSTHPHFKVGDFIRAVDTGRTYLVISDTEAKDRHAPPDDDIRKYSIVYYAHIRTALIDKYGVRCFLTYSTANSIPTNFQMATPEDIAAARILNDT